VNVTVRGAVPEVGIPENAAFGATGNSAVATDTVPARKKRVSTIRVYCPFKSFGMVRPRIAENRLTGFVISIIG
jgi:hypothetical protein